MDPLVSLDSILQNGFPPEKVLAFENDRSFCWGEFRDRVGGLAGFLDQNKPGPWLVHCSSATAFLVAIYALWTRGRTCILPPNAQQDTLEDLAQDGVCGLLSDENPQPTTGSIARAHPFHFPLSSLNECRINPDAPLVELFTSGSTGNRKRVTKNLSQLISEIVSLENLFGPRLGEGTTVLSTVSHQHIYGLLFRLLWPLCAGRPFESHNALFWQSIRDAMERHENNILVTSPSHLERVEEGVSRPPRVVFSSGGVLHKHVSLRAGQILKSSPIEVFGSTETGGVGWRSQNPEDDMSPWTPLSSVSVTALDNGELSVCSPHTGNRPIALGDAGTVLSSGQFIVHGRTDRVIKRAGKKLSLDELESRLTHHPFVKEAHIVLLPTDAPEPSLGAAIQLSPQGRSRFDDRGPKELIREFRTHLLNSFDPTLLPRRFRWVESFLRNSQGKIVHDDIVKQFVDNSNPEPILPEVRHSVFSENEARFDGIVPPDLFYFNGHFPNFPIVPGIVQVQWAIQSAEKWLGFAVEPKGLEAIKFKNPMRPGALFSLRLSRGQTPSHRFVDFSFFNGERVYGSGRILLP